MMTKLVSISLLIAVVVGWGLTQAQSSDSGLESRLPKGLPGLLEGQDAKPSTDWLLDARDDEERFRRIQIYAGGTYEQMWQIGYRYQQVYSAIEDENWDLALYHWRKLKNVFNVALMKRPARTPKAEPMFLDNAWGRLEQALIGKNEETIKGAFLEQRASCMACHAAEGMPFLNDTPIFRDTAAFPDG